MLIAQISDTHILARASSHPIAQRRQGWLRDCVADINRQLPDAVIFTGDTVQYGEPEEYAHLRSLLAPLRAPLYLIPGNRDDAAALRTAFRDRPYLPTTGAFLHYVIEDHALRLVAIDSTAPGERKGVFCPARAAWLDSVLGERADRPTLLFVHHPPFDIGAHYIGGYRRAEEAAAFAAVVRRHRQVVRLVCGHVHCLVERPWAGTVASVMPSIAVDVRRGIDEAEAGCRPIYMLHRLSGGTDLVSLARRVEGTDAPSPKTLQTREGPS